MSNSTDTDTSVGEVRIVKPGEAREFWQPVPANGHIAVHLAPDLVKMDVPFSLGTQTVAPDSFVREHAHDRNEEVVHCLYGEGRAVIDGISHPMEPGTTFYIGKNRRHMFINEGKTDLHFLWLMTPNGLESFFEQIGRPKSAGQPAPEPFPRPADVLEIERRTVFAEPVDGSGS